MDGARSYWVRAYVGPPSARALAESVLGGGPVRRQQAVLVSRTKAINELKSLIVAAPEHLRPQLRGLALTKQLGRIEELHRPAGANVEHRTTILTLRSIAARIRFLIAQTAELDPELLALNAPVMRTGGTAAGAQRWISSRRPRPSPCRSGATLSLPISYSSATSRPRAEPTSRWPSRTT